MRIGEWLDGLFLALVLLVGFVWFLIELTDEILPAMGVK